MGVVGMEARREEWMVGNKPASPTPSSISSTHHPHHTPSLATAPHALTPLPPRQAHAHSPTPSTHPYRSSPFCLQRTQRQRWECKSPGLRAWMMRQERRGRGGQCPFGCVWHTAVQGQARHILLRGLLPACVWMRGCVMGVLSLLPAVPSASPIEHPFSSHFPLTPPPPPKTKPQHQARQGGGGVGRPIRREEGSRGEGLGRRHGGQEVPPCRGGGH